MAGVTRGSEKFKGFFPATDETGGNKFLGKFMIELSRTIFFSQTPARISPAPVKLSSISLPSPYSSLLAPPCEIVRIKTERVSRRVSRAFLTTAYLLTARRESATSNRVPFGATRRENCAIVAISLASRALFKTHDPPRLE